MNTKSAKLAGKAFFDTNVLIYQFDQTNPVKQKQAQELIEQCIREERAVISSQVVQEFMNVALKKFDSVLQLSDAKLVISELLWPLCRHTPSKDFYERVMDLHQLNSLSFYDAMIVQAAIDLGCKTLYTEDLQHGRSYHGVMIVNPFSS